MHSPEDERGLREQIDYYRRRAPEYDETVQGEADADELRFGSWLRRLGPAGEVLEIACGTGLWTQHLIGAARSVTALDSSPEMIELARARLGDESVRFVVADFFRWRPDRRYDCAFFGFWLSHVPPHRFTDFWARVEGCLAPGGRALFVDESAERGPREPSRVRRSAYVERRLRDGSTFRIVKVFHEPDDLAAALGRLGWSPRVERVENGFLLGAAKPPAGTSD